MNENMKLVFMRHGIAEDGGFGMDDRDRQLTKDGIVKTRVIGDYLDKIKLKFDEICTSPYARALKTAEIIVDALGQMDKLTVESGLAPGFQMSDLVRIMHDKNRRGRYLFVGHNPSFSIVPMELIGGGNIELKKGGIISIETDIIQPGAGLLEWMLTPGLMVKANGESS